METRPDPLLLIFVSVVRLLLGLSTVDSPKSKRTTDTKISNKGSGRVSIVTRNDRLARQRRQIEVAKTRTPDIHRRTISVRGGKAGALVELTIEVSILSGNDVEPRPRVRDDEGI